MKKLRFAALTPARWDAFAKLFGTSGVTSGCWCMWWRLERKDFRAGLAANKRRMKKLVDSGVKPGLLAFSGREAVGWIALAPRGDYPGLAKARTLQPVDDKPVWSVTCFFVAKAHRGRGVTTQLLNAAAEYARKEGATLLEGYPNQPAVKWPDAGVYTGVVGAFTKAGFKVVAKPSSSRRIMRRRLTAASRSGSLNS